MTDDLENIIHEHLQVGTYPKELAKAIEQYVIQAMIEELRRLRDKCLDYKDYCIKSSERIEELKNDLKDLH